jgi:hypothetical protein
VAAQLAASQEGLSSMSEWIEIIYGISIFLLNVLLINKSLFGAPLHQGPWPNGPAGLLPPSIWARLLGAGIMSSVNWIEASAIFSITMLLLTLCRDF